MALGTFWKMAYRDIVRNRRRTFTTMIAVALGLMVVLLMAGMLEGVFDSALRDNIRTTTGHLQLRNESYEIEKMSLLARDLLQDPDALAAQVEALPEVQSVAPVLWASTVLSTPRESSGLQITGIDPNNPFHDVVRQGNVIRLRSHSDLEYTSVAVAEACNGLRMVTAFFVVCGLVILICQAPHWQKLCGLISCLPIALICNTIRLVLTAIMFTILDGQKWELFFHDFGGYAMMPLAVAMISLEFWFLSKLFVVKSDQEKLLYARCEA